MELPKEILVIEKALATLQNFFVNELFTNLNLANGFLLK